MSSGDLVILGSKGRRLRSQCRSSDRTQYYRCCEPKPWWVFRAAMPRHTSNASDSGFSLRHVPASACGWVFPGVNFCTLMLLLILILNSL